MSTDQSLVTFLRALQGSRQGDEVFRLLGSATTLLTLLTNPLNVTLLTSQILLAPSVWRFDHDLSITLRLLGVFSNACRQVLEREVSRPSASSPFNRADLNAKDWILAVIKGLDEKAARCRHLCILAGLQLGISDTVDNWAAVTVRWPVEEAIVTATNTGLSDQGDMETLDAASIALSLGHVFDRLDDHHKGKIHYEAVLPLLVKTCFFSKNGLHSGYFLSSIDADVRQKNTDQFEWSPRCQTFVQLRDLAKSPILGVFGAISRLMAYAIEHSHNTEVLNNLATELESFSRCFCLQWRQNKLSEIDHTEEQIFLDANTVRESLPLLWQVLRSTLFSVIVVLRSMLARILIDHVIPYTTAPLLTIQALHILRNLSFISLRMGTASLSQYSYTYYTAIDVLTQFPIQAEAFLEDIRPKTFGIISQHPLDRCQDLFFLNLGEQLARLLSPERNEELLIGAATPYLGVSGDSRLLEIFEAAHSVMLAVLSAAQNSNLISRLLHPYMEALFAAFPENLSPRQFRFAIKTLVQITSPPAPIFELQPLLPSVILELVLSRVNNTAIIPLAPLSEAIATQVEQKTPQGMLNQNVLSERSTLVMTLIDSLPYLPTVQLQEWLDTTAFAVHLVADADQQNACKKQFWDILSQGEMDVTRSSICIAWWSTFGGRDKVMNGVNSDEQSHLMSGALVEGERL